MSLGEKIAALRKSRSMSQEQLAGELGISRQAVSKWELNESMPDIDKVAALSKLFGVSADYLIIHDDDQSNRENSPNNSGDINKYKTRTVLGWVLSSIGAFGIIVLITLSSFIETNIPVVYRNADGLYSYTYRTGYSFFPFIKEHNLGFLLSVFIVFFISGLALLLSKKIKGKHRYKGKDEK
jgi:transcriptional regulator with XRE-family HTH domain